MFDKTKEVPSLELCRKLKKLGYPQDGGGWYWIKSDKRWILVFSKDGDSYLVNYTDGEYIEANIPKDKIKAPTVRELGEWLPEEFFGCFLHCSKYRNLWVVSYQDENGDIWSPHFNKAEFEAPSLANAYARILVWLVENRYVKFEKERK